MIYLDNAATTPLDSRVLETMYEFMKTTYGNPSSKYYNQAENSKKILNWAREEVAKLINCQPDEIIFTSGATESNNFILKGVANAFKDKGKHIVTTKVEHSSVLEVCRYLERCGYEVTYLDVDHYGRVDPEELKRSIKEDTILVSVVWGNNEIGTINDVKSIAEICKEKGVLFHTDATQALGKIKVNLAEIEADFLSISAHKIYGPKGVGACFIRKDKNGLRIKVEPLLHGGEQEYSLRAGTQPVHNIVGFGKACEIVREEMHVYVKNILMLEEMFVKKLLAEIPKAKINGDLSNKLPGILSITIEGINNELFLKWVSDRYALSSGSACSINKPSQVLKAIGMEQYSKNTIRVSIGRFNNENILGLIDSIKEYLERYTL
jgi:cysteine desulfurase